MAMELIQDDDRTWGGKEGQELGATVYMNEGAPTWGGGAEDDNSGEGDRVVR